MLEFLGNALHVAGFLMVCCMIGMIIVGLLGIIVEGAQDFLAGAIRKGMERSYEDRNHIREMESEIRYLNSRLDIFERFNRPDAIRLPEYPATRRYDFDDENQGGAAAFAR